MILTQTQILAMSGRLLSESRRFADAAKPGRDSFYHDYVISSILSSIAISLHAAYDAGQPAAVEERQYEGK